MTDSELRDYLERFKKITVIGISRDPSKPSYQIPKYLEANGYQVFGVHPSATEIDGIPCVKSLAEVPADYRHFVDVFRPSNEVRSVIEQTLKVGGVDILFFQLGIQDPQAENELKAECQKAGLRVISNRCLLIEHKRLFKI